MFKKITELYKVVKMISSNNENVYIPEQNAKQNPPSNILPKDKLWLTCPQCRNFPIIKTRIENKKFLLQIICKCSPQDRLCTFPEYINILKEKKEIKNSCDFNKNHHLYNAVNYCFDCDKFLCGICYHLHKTLHSEHTISDEETHIDIVCDRHLENNNIVSFCLDCHMNLCEKCLKDHDPYHLIYKARELFSQSLCDKTYEEFKESQIFLDEMEKTKETFLEKLENNAELKSKFLDAYNTNKEINKDIIDFISLLYENYMNTIEDRPNINIIMNLKENSSFKSKAFKYEIEKTPEENLESFINFADKSFIFRTKDSPLEKITSLKIPANLLSSEVIYDMGNNKLLQGDWNNFINIIDLNTGILMQTFIGHFDSISTVAALKNGWVISGGRDSSINLYDPYFDCRNFQDMEEYKDGTIFFRGYIDGFKGKIQKILKLKMGNILICSDKVVNYYDGEIVEMELDKNKGCTLFDIEKEKTDKEKSEEKIDSKSKKKEEAKKNQKNDAAPEEEQKEKTEEELKKEEEEKLRQEEIQRQKEIIKQKQDFLNKRYTLKLIKNFSTSDIINDIYEMKNGQIFLCQKDKKIKVLDLVKLVEVKTIDLKDATPLKLVEVSDQKVAVACVTEQGNCLRFYSFNDDYEFNMEKEFILHHDKITDLKRLLNGNVATCSLDGTVIVYNPEKFSFVCKIDWDEKKELTGLLQLSDRRVVVSGADCAFRILE